MKKNVMHGEAREIEDIVRLRPWMEDEWRDMYGNFKKTKLTTDYDAERNVFKFRITFFS